MKQIVRFQEGICPEKIQLVQIQNGRLLAIINTNMHNICQTLLVNYRLTITLKEEVVILD